MIRHVPALVVLSLCACTGSVDGFDGGSGGGATGGGDATGGGSLSPFPRTHLRPRGPPRNSDCPVGFAVLPAE